MEKTSKLYGDLPIDLGRVDLDCFEMMFWLYLPVKLPYSKVIVPDTLKKYEILLDMVRDDLGDWEDKYVYMTAKTLWVNPDNTGNRAGWHSDGFLTDDLNYLWYDKNPTKFFCNGDKRYVFTKDHVVSLVEMDRLCESSGHSITYPEKHLLKLDERVLHKVDTDIDAGVRTFIKISVSNHPYRMVGNSINHSLTGNWTKFERGSERNCPANGGET